MCRKDARDPRQYFMCKDEMWQQFCLDNHLPLNALVCADCFETKIGRILKPRDLIFVPINLAFLKARYPQEYDLYNLGIKYMP